MSNPITKKHFIDSLPKERPWEKKAILQYSKEGYFIREWDSATDFGKSINKNVSGNINACINGRQKTAYGYTWKFKN